MQTVPCARLEQPESVGLCKTVYFRPHSCTPSSRTRRSHPNGYGSVVSGLGGGAGMPASGITRRIPSVRLWRYHSRLVMPCDTRLRPRMPFLYSPFRMPRA